MLLNDMKSCVSVGLVMIGGGVVGDGPGVRSIDWGAA